MKKATLETFIKRYTLAGLIPKVKWKYSAVNQRLHTRAAVDNRAFLADVIMNNFSEFGPEDLIMCIGDTEKVKSLMSPFTDDITFTVEKKDDRVLGFRISDVDCESYCACADPSAMDPAPKDLSDLSEYHVEVPMTAEFIEKFRAAQNALKDVQTFSVGMNKRGIFEFVIGHSTSNSNRIRLTPQTDAVRNKLSTTIEFPIKHIIEAIRANADIDDGLLSINDRGVIRLSFKNDTYHCTYFQFANKKQ
jgi:hypothetical protein